MTTYKSALFTIPGLLVREEYRHLMAEETPLLNTVHISKHGKIKLLIIILIQFYKIPFFFSSM